jgi:hypothetical protein
MVEYGDVRAAVAAIARVSYDRFVPEQRTIDGMQRLIDLFTRLAADHHYSPFEHIAVWSDNAPIGPFACQPDDVYLPDDVYVANSDLANSTSHANTRRQDYWYQDYWQQDYWYRRPFAAWVSYRALIDGTIRDQQYLQSCLQAIEQRYTQGE